MSTLQVDTINDTSGNLNPTLVAGTAQATTSGTEFTFSGIPAGVKRVTVQFDGVSLSGTNHILVQIGDAGGIEATGYSSSGGLTDNVGGSSVANSTAGFVVAYLGLASRTYSGIMTIAEVDTDDWVASAAGGNGGTIAHSAGGRKTLSGTLTQLKILATGANTFDAGQVNILYE